MTYEIGSIVSARSREWIVQAGSTEELLLLSPLGGTAEELTGIYTPLEKVTSAGFSLPNPNLPGDWHSCQLLQDALMLGFRNTAGPFRSFGHLNVDPRPYQFVPLILAMRLDPVRMLIADDVGIGKTVEALLIARELMDRGEADGITVLCPPHLTEQWKKEMDEKFHIEAELVLGSTAVKLERDIGYDRSLFDVYPNTIVSLDYIKNPQKSSEFQRSCRNLVIVDEAHSCTEDFTDQTGHRRQRQQRYELLKNLAKDPGRHMILLTATPHSGKEGNFRSLLSLLDSEFTNMPVDLRGDQNRKHRERLAKHFVQRRRADIEAYLRDFTGTGGSSPFPSRKTIEVAYATNSEYQALLRKALDWARYEAGDHLRGEHTNQSRVKWWSALALLHACSSSPAAAVATMMSRAGVDEDLDFDQIDDLGRAQVLDGDTDQAATFSDTAYQASIPASRTAKALLDMAEQAKALMGDRDPKLIQIVKPVEELIKEGKRPIIFCRYVDTAEYLARELRKRLSSSLKVRVEAVTGLLSPEERLSSIEDMCSDPKQNRVLVATDCLSEGINLQEYFDAVIHYDLSWNPTRHEQREGRVDRFGQPSREVKTLTYYGRDNPVDGIVLKTLIRKHENIIKTLGISVPIPMDSNAVGEAIMESLLLTDVQDYGEQLMFGEVLNMGIQLEGKWLDAAKREHETQTLFAQQSVQSEEVFDLYRRSIRSLGSDRLMCFLHSAFMLNGVPAGRTSSDALEVDLGHPQAAKLKLNEAMDLKGTVRLQAHFPAGPGETYILRTHPITAALAGMIFSDALEDAPLLKARRCGVVVTRDVPLKTTLLLLRLRFGVKDYYNKKLISEKIAEECVLAGITSDGASERWLANDEINKLANITPGGDMLPDFQKAQLKRELANLPRHAQKLEALAIAHRDRLLKEHNSVREAAGRSGETKVEWIQGLGEIPLDIVGIYLLIPVTAGR